MAPYDPLCPRWIQGPAGDRAPIIFRQGAPFIVEYLSEDHAVAIKTFGDLEPGRGGREHLEVGPRHDLPPSGSGEAATDLL
uniref:hypothetical protein n=1 Tax=Brevundimonas mediterranea TaxID=74329 RepID=UPI004033EC2F